MPSTRINNWIEQRLCACLIVPPGSLLTMLCLVAILFISPKTAEAQFIRLQFSVEEEFFVGNLVYLNPGELRPDYGWTNIPIGDVAAGRLSITAAENIELLVTVEASEELVKDPDNKIPFEITPYYINDGTNLSRNAVLFENNTVIFPVHNSGLLVDRMEGRTHRLEAHLLFASSLYVGNIDPGTYYGIITIRIEI